jgi:formylglycine-generating enzyme required for sulfatase activity
MEALNMSGNVWEWTADWYKKDYYEISPLKNPKGPDTGVSRVLKGGGCFHNLSPLRPASRLGFNSADQDYCIGFRCVKD